MTTLDLTDVARLAAGLADPGNRCESCCTEMPGVLAPCIPNGDTRHNFVQRCDSCQRYASDEEAAIAFAKRTGLNAHRCYDDEELKYWHSFVSRPGDPDDHDVHLPTPTEEI